MLIRLFFACILVFTDLEVLSMLHEVSFHSFNGRDEVQGWVYVPACKPKGIVQVIHGFGEHSRRYFHMIVKFMDAGYIVAADDHVGHGKTAMYNDKMCIRDSRIYIINICNDISKNCCHGGSCCPLV